MSCGINGFSNENKDRPIVNYFRNRTDPDPFPDESFMDSIDENQQKAVLQDVEKGSNKAIKNVLPLEHQDRL